MITRVVGAGDCGISADKEEVLVTKALGSGVAVAIYDPVARVGGLLNMMLPESSADPGQARENPYMFADTGIPLLFRTACSRGAEKWRLNVYVSGGDQLMDDHGILLGKRNFLATRKSLWKAGVLIGAEDFGGNGSRSVRLDMGTGEFWLRGAGEAERLVAAQSRA